MNKRVGVALLTAGLVATGLCVAVSVSASAPYSCTETSFTGRCGSAWDPRGSYVDYPLIQGTQGGTNAGGPYVDQNVWSPLSGETQTLYANSPGDWMVTNKTPVNSSGSVTAFPNVGAPYNEQALSSFPVIIGSFSETMPHTAGTSAWATYDNWFDNWTYEVMIQHDFVGNGPCDYVGVATFGGSNGVPSQLWGLCKYGSELIWKLAAPGSTVGTNKTVNESSGSVDIKAMITWLVDHGYMAANPTITNLSYGWEICSTAGTAQNFTVSSYSLITQTSSLSSPTSSSSSPTSSPTSSSSSPTSSPTSSSTSSSPTSSPTSSSTSSSPTSSPTSSSSPSPSGSTSSTASSSPTSASNGTTLVGDDRVESVVDGDAAGTAEAFSYVAGVSGSSATVSFYVDASNRATGGRLGVYTDSGWDSPGKLLKQASFKPTPGWNTVKLSGASIAAGRKYWLAVLGTGGQLAFRVQGYGSKDEESKQSSLTSLPSRWSDGTAWSSGQASFYLSA